ncbi:glycogen synthase, partial [bacterium (Candidatus Gribaldobacteria) CG07_land_8_20_14_0_80_33_18]
MIQQGILNADFINTVSPTYAQEILTKPYFSRGLKETLLKRRNNFVGILNGLDTKTFNPETDPYIKKNYSFR